MRWAEGFVCPKCGAVDEPFKIKSRNLYQCKHCNHQVSVTAGTVLEKTRIPLLKWFWAMFLMSNDKRGCSSEQLGVELNLCYSTAWFLSHRIRSAMGERDTQYVLSGYIEADDAFFGAPISNGKRGRGTDKTVVLVGLSLNEKGHPLYAKMQISPDVKGGTVAVFAEKNVEPGATIASDGYASYNILAKKGFVHEGRVCDPVSDPEHLKWLHTIISNAKAFIAGTYHGLGDKHLQRFNRRKFTLQHFDRTLFACIFAPKLSYSVLTR